MLIQTMISILSRKSTFIFKNEKWYYDDGEFY